MTQPAAALAHPIRVLIVDDSAFMRRALERLLAAVPGIEVVATAADGVEGVKRALEFRPDVITMDVEMPRMDGVAAVAEIMQTVPTPIVMVSSLTQEGAATTIRALEAGAVECVGKPSGLSTDLADVAEVLQAAVTRASFARPQRRRPQGLALPHSVRRAVASEGGVRIPARHLVVIGSSTGGPPALTRLVPHLPANLGAAVLIVQHMPAGFTAALARRLDSISPLAVTEAVDGESLHTNHVYVAPGDFHVVVGRDWRLRLDPGPALHGVRPSIDVTLDSVAGVFGPAATVAILTGMGKDGADGAAKVETAGGKVFVQDEATSVVYGMPRVALEKTQHAMQLPIDQMAAALATSVGAPKRAG